MAFLARWRRKTAGAAAPEVLAGYFRPGWLSRHRKLVLAATFIVIFFYSALFLLIGRFLIVQFAAPLALLVLLIIWALPETEKAPGIWLRGSFTLFIGATVFWPNYLAIDVPPLPWITASRLIGIPMVLLLLICLSQSANMRIEMKQSLAASPTISKMMVAFAVLCVASVGFSISPGSSATNLIIAVVNWISVFFVAVYVFARKEAVERFARMLWVAVVFWCVMGIWEWSISRVPWGGYIPSFLAVDYEGLERILSGTARKATGIYRVQGKYVTALSMAEFMALCAPFIIHFLCVSKGIITRCAAAITLPFMFFIIICTDSRLGVIGFFSSILLYILFLSLRHWLHHRDSLFGPAVVLAYPIGFALFMAATFAVRRLRNMVWGGGATAASNDARTQQWAMGLEDLIDRPWGHGLGRGAEALGFVSPGGKLTIDTYYLSILLEIGIIGFIVYYGMFLIAIVRGGLRGLKEENSQQLWVIPAVISLANFFLTKSVLSQQETHSLAFAILGMVVAILAQPAGAAKRAIIPPSSLPVGQFGKRSRSRMVSTG